MCVQKTEFLFYFDHGERFYENIYSRNGVLYNIFGFVLYFLKVSFFKKESWA